MSSDNHQEVIAGLPLFKAFPDTLKQRIAAVFVEVSEHKHMAGESELLRAQGQSSNDGYILLQGSVSIARRVSAPSEAGAPALLGGMKEFDPHNERTADVTAVGDVEILRFDWDRFYARLKEQLAPSEFAIFGRALQNYSWLNFLGDDT